MDFVSTCMEVVMANKLGLLFIYGCKLVPKGHKNKYLLSL